MTSSYAETHYVPVPLLADPVSTIGNLGPTRFTHPVNSAALIQAKHCYSSARGKDTTTGQPDQARPSLSARIHRRALRLEARSILNTDTNNPCQSVRTNSPVCSRCAAQPTWLRSVSPRVKSRDSTKELPSQEKPVALSAA
ncbi:hypothetical protein THAOC_17349, partial [Thalassiosira oceanica]